MKNANLLSRVAILLIVGVGVLLAGCNRGDEGQSGPAKPADTYFPIKLGSKTVQLQFAVHPMEMQRGLMERKDLGVDQGMIFISPRPTRLVFYMRNTPTPLDIGYFDKDGVLREVYRMFPYDETNVSSRADNLQFAVEMNQDWYHNNDIKAGAKLDMKAVRAAIKARGIAPEQMGIYEQR